MTRPLATDVLLGPGVKQIGGMRLTCSCRYDAIVKLTASLNGMSNQPRDTQERTRLILQSLFPAWLPPAFEVILLAQTFRILTTSCRWHL